MGSVGVVLILYTVDEGQALSVDLTAPSRSDDVLTFAYTIRTERAAASGPAAFSVLYNSTVQHTRTVTPEAGGGRLDVHFRDFVVGNGDYVFRLDYKGVRGTTTYTIGTPDRTDFIVTAVGSEGQNIWVGDDLRTGAIRFSALFYSDISHGFQTKAPPNSSLSIQLKKNGFPDGSAIVVGAEGQTTVARTINVSLGPGNYTVEMTFTNQWVKDDAPIKVMTSGNASFVHNKPKACVVLPPSGVYHGNSANNFTITADDSCSVDDIAVVRYVWDFGDGTAEVTVNGVPTASHQYPSSFVTQSYSASLQVFDNLGEFDFAFFTATTASS